MRTTASWLRRRVLGRARLVVGPLLVLAVLVAIPAAFAAKPGNAPTAKACQKGGWEALLRADGTSFANEQACTSYGAQGGVLYPASVGPCLGTGFLTKATSNGDPFDSAEACIAFIESNAGTLVSCTRVGTSGDDALSSASTGEVVCGFGGHDTMMSVAAGAAFYGGAGSDSVRDVLGTFDAGADIDSVLNLSGGTYDGGDGNDGVHYLDAGIFNGEGGDDVAGFIPPGGTFNGGDGADTATGPTHGTFNGGLGDDLTGTVADGGVVNGDDGNDRTFVVNAGGVFNGGADADWVSLELGGAGAIFNGGDGNDAAETVRSGGVVNGEGGDDRVGVLEDGTFNGGGGTDTVCVVAGAFTTTEVEITGCG
jgi:hypothetical protein